jgi:hypothetical protein
MFHLPENIALLSPCKHWSSVGVPAGVSSFNEETFPCGLSPFFGSPRGDFPIRIVASIVWLSFG